ncbi:MAG: DUF4870 domain-containing protein [Bacteroidetes bacterium]|nr:DUF4870 domain-containing protein [Bacteroidota bacterium]
MASVYEDLEKLNDLKNRGIISETEFQAQKEKLLNRTAPSGDFMGMDERTYCMVLHGSVLLGLIIPYAGFVVPLILWLVNKDKSSRIDAHGKVVMNWVLTALIIAVAGLVLTFVFVGIGVLLALAVCNLVFSILGLIRAGDGILWHYPFSIRFFPVTDPYNKTTNL